MDRLSFVDLRVQETEVWCPYQSQDLSLRSSTCSKLETRTESPGLDLHMPQTVCCCDTTSRTTCVARSCDLYQKQMTYQTHKTEAWMHTAQWSPAVMIGSPRPSHLSTCAPSPEIQDCCPKWLETVASLLQQFQTRPAASLILHPSPAKHTCDNSCVRVGRTMNESKHMLPLPVTLALPMPSTQELHKGLGQ